MIDEILTIVAPITNATVAFASVYFVMDKINFEFAALFASIVFIITLLHKWGDSDITEA
jgi:ABC-type transport system involved in cytochrome bd biosynthesis fused ATPase/permease subunit